MFRHISYDTISHILSFMSLEDLIKLKRTSKEMKDIIEKYGLIENAFKYKVLYFYPRLDEALAYNEPKNIKINWVDIYKNMESPEFLKDAFMKSILYQCDNIMISKPLVMGIYNLTFELSTKRRNSDFSEWCYRNCADIIHKNVMKLKTHISVNGRIDYDKEKMKYKAMLDWISKSTGYLHRYLVPNTGIPSLNEFGITLFNEHIINHFHIQDTYEQSAMLINELRETHLPHVIWSYLDNR